MRRGLKVVSEKRQQDAPAKPIHRWTGKPGARLAFVLLIVAGVLNTIGFAFFFDIVWSFDKVVHAYTSFAVAYTLAVALQDVLLARLRPHYTLIVCSLVAYVLALGVLWELGEWAVDIRGYPTVITGKSDTMIDLIADAIGAWLAALYVVGRLRAGKGFPGA